MPHSRPAYAETAVSASEPFPPLPDAQEVLAEHRPRLIEDLSLAAHEVLAPEGVPFSRVRAAVGDALAALEQGLADPARAALSSLPLERDIASCVQQGLSFVALVRALHAGYAPLNRIGDERIAVTGSALVERLVGAAASELDTTHRASLRRRAAIADRVRSAAATLAGSSADADAVLQAVARAAADGLACDWAAVAQIESDGRCSIVATVGRSAGWMQRWQLRADLGFVQQTIASPGSVVTHRPDAMPFEGEGRPEALISFAVRDAARRPIAIAFCGRDGGEPLGSEDMALADGLGEIACRALEAAQAASGAQRLTARLVDIDRAAEAAIAGDETRALALLAGAARELGGAQLVLVQQLEPDGAAVIARAVHADAASLSAELAGTSWPVRGPVADALAGRESTFTAELCEPALARRLQARGGDLAGIVFPIQAGPRARALLQVLRAGTEQLSEAERELVRHVAIQIALVLNAGPSHASSTTGVDLTAAGDALLAGGDVGEIGRVTVRQAAASCGADAAAVYRREGDGLEAVATFGGGSPAPLVPGPGDALAVAAMRRGEPVLTGDGGGVTALSGRVETPIALSLPLLAQGEAQGVLQLFFSDRERAERSFADAPLALFCARAAEALARAVGVERERARADRSRSLADALMAGGALSIEQVLARAAALADAPIAGVWTRSPDGELQQLARIGSGDPAPLVTALVDESEGRAVTRERLAADARFSGLSSTLSIGSACLEPLRFDDAEVGFVGLFGEGQRMAEGSAEIAARIAGVLAALVAAGRERVRADELARSASASEREVGAAAARLAAYDAIADTLIEDRSTDDELARRVAVVGGAVCGAVQRVGEHGLEPGALHVSSDALRAPVTLVLGRPLDASVPAVRRALDGETVIVLGGSADARTLAPFLQAGSSAALVPIGPPRAVSGIAVLVSLDPARPLSASGMREVRRLCARA